jgi:hypothetical protein
MKSTLPTFIEPRFFSLLDGSGAPSNAAGVRGHAKSKYPEGSCAAGPVNENDMNKLRNMEFQTFDLVRFRHGGALAADTLCSAPRLSDLRWGPTFLSPCSSL